MIEFKKRANKVVNPTHRTGVWRLLREQKKKETIDLGNWNIKINCGAIKVDCRRKMRLSPYYSRCSVQ
jgi:hypothetical protein